QDRKVRIHLKQRRKPRRPHENPNAAYADINTAQNRHANGRPHPNPSICLRSLVQLHLPILRDQLRLLASLLTHSAFEATLLRTNKRSNITTMKRDELLAWIRVVLAVPPIVYSVFKEGQWSEPNSFCFYHSPNSRHRIHPS